MKSLFMQWGVVGGGILLSTFTLAAVNTLTLQITGQLVSQPCYLKADDDIIKVDMETITDQDITNDMRTKAKKFQIHLERCNPIIAKNVKVTFIGTSAVGNSSFLALNSNSQAKGIAIGLEEKDGTALSINKASKLVSITSGNMVLEFGVYVKVLSAKDLTPGSFNASALVKIDYQ